MAKYITHPAGYEALTVTGTTLLHPLGTIVQTDDTDYGPGEAIYLQGIGSTAIGSVVFYDGTFVTNLAGAREKGPVAVALSANGASNYGWYAITGCVPAKAGTVNASAQAYLTATPGTIDDAIVAGDFIAGATFRTADGTPAAGSAILDLNRSFICDADNA